MKSEQVIRVLSGIRNIYEFKWKAMFLVIYTLFIFYLWEFTRTHLPTFKFLSLPNLYTFIFGVFMIEIAVLGLLRILILIGTPVQSGKIERKLTEAGFVDNVGKPPMLISMKKEKNGIVIEFFSPRLSFYEYEKNQAKLETIMNIKIISIDLGKDMQHVIVKAVAYIKSKSQFIFWDDSFLDNDEFVLKLGEGYFGDVGFDLSVIPHVLIGGGSGSGKSKLLKLILMQSIKKGAKVYLADFKGGVDYSKVWHEKCSIIFEAEKLSNQLSEILEILEYRRRDFLECGASNIHEYNSKVDSKMQRIIVACDEVAEVLDKTGMDKDDKTLVSQIESKLSTIARQGRAFGIHLILATQRPDADVLKGQIKNNIGMKICGRADRVLSQIILDNTEGAEKISPDDQGVFLTNTKVLFKAYYIEDDCLEG